MTSASTFTTLALASANPDTYGAKYEDHLFDQYKLYVEMADRISARRSLANSLFVTVHTALITAFTVLLKEGILARSPIGYVPFVAVVFLCYLWWRLLVSYRQLNTGKFVVIHAVEERLPLALYAAEWRALGEGRDDRLYRPLTHVEQWVPASFAALYALMAGSLWLQ